MAWLPSRTIDNGPAARQCRPLWTAPRVRRTVQARMVGLGSEKKDKKKVVIIGGGWAGQSGPQVLNSSVGIWLPWLPTNVNQPYVVALCLSITCLLHLYYVY